MGNGPDCVEAVVALSAVATDLVVLQPADDVFHPGADLAVLGADIRTTPGALHSRVRPRATDLEAHGDRMGRGYALWLLGWDAWARGDLEAGTRFARSSLDAGRAFDDYHGTAQQLELLACLSADAGNHTVGTPARRRDRPAARAGNRYRRRQPRGCAEPGGSANRRWCGHSAREPTRTRSTKTHVTAPPPGRSPTPCEPTAPRPAPAPSPRRSPTR